MKRLIVFALIPLILSIGITPALSFDDVFADKSKGTPLSVTGSDKVCGDQLCSTANVPTPPKGQIVIPDTDKKIDSDVQLLFVQTANSGTFEEKNGRQILTLVGISPTTVYFSDRPDRISGFEKTELFVALWGEGEDSFSNDPPNAALELLDWNEQSDVFILELTNPVYNYESEILQYDVKILEEASEGLTQYNKRNDPKIPATFENSVLFIDDALGDFAKKVGNEVLDEGEKDAKAVAKEAMKAAKAIKDEAIKDGKAAVKATITVPLAALPPHEIAKFVRGEYSDIKELGENIGVEFGSRYVDIICDDNGKHCLSKFDAKHVGISAYEFLASDGNTFILSGNDIEHLSHGDVGYVYQDLHDSAFNIHNPVIDLIHKYQKQQMKKIDFFNWQEKYGDIEREISNESSKLGGEVGYSLGGPVGKKIGTKAGEILGGQAVLVMTSTAMLYQINDGSDVITSEDILNHVKSITEPKPKSIPHHKMSQSLAEKTVTKATPLIEAKISHLLDVILGIYAAENHSYSCGFLSDTLSHKITLEVIQNLNDSLADTVNNDLNNGLSLDEIKLDISQKIDHSITSIITKNLSNFTLQCNLEGHEGEKQFKTTLSLVAMDNLTTTTNSDQLYNMLHEIKYLEEYANKAIQDSIHMKAIELREQSRATSNADREEVKKFHTDVINLQLVASQKQHDLGEAQAKYNIALRNVDSPIKPSTSAADFVDQIDTAKTTAKDASDNLKQAEDNVTELQQTADSANSLMYSKSSLNSFSIGADSLSFGEAQNEANQAYVEYAKAQGEAIRTEIELADIQTKYHIAQRNAYSSDVRDATNNLEQSQAKLDTAQSNLDTATSDVRYTTNNLKQSQGKVDEAQLKLDTATSDVQDTTNNLEQSQAKLDEAQLKLNDAGKNAHDAAENLKRTEYNADLLQGIADGTLDGGAQGQAALAQVENALAKGDAAVTEGEFQQAKGEFQQAKRALKQSQANADKAQLHLDEAKINAEDATNNLKQSQGKVDEAQVKLDGAKTNAEDATEDLESLQAKLDDAQLKLDDAKANVENYANPSAEPASESVDNITNSGEMSSSGDTLTITTPNGDEFDQLGDEFSDILSDELPSQIEQYLSDPEPYVESVADSIGEAIGEDFAEMMTEEFAEEMATVIAEYMLS